MARPMNKLHQEDVRKKFYVYELFDANGVQYVGKGSGARFVAQKRRFGLDGRIVEAFASEAAAYRFEKRRIADAKPPMNKCAGGNGSRAKAERKPRWLKDIERMGTRIYAARLLLRYEWVLPPAVVAQVRAVAHG